MAMRASVKRTLLVALVGAAIGTATLRSRQPRRVAAASSSSPIHHSSRRARNLELTRVATKAGGSLAVHKARSVFASSARREELDRRFELKTAESVVSALGNMKGALMKLGQMASYLDQGLPEATRDALSQLQSDAPPMSAELASQVIEQELGKKPEDLFAEWDPVPIASASIGQVHRAITRDGHAVAVKVQYPGVDAAIAADLENVDFMFNAMSMLFPGVDPAPIVEELQTRLVEELDYENEANNQRLFRDYYRDHPHIHIPMVFDEYSSQRVLTTELAEGVRFEEVKGWSEDERNLAAETIYRFVFGSIYQLAVFNGDPHPGNYLFRPGGEVTFLDFGLVKHFEEEIPLFVDMISAMVLERDVVRFRRILEDVQVLRRDPDLTDQEVWDYFVHFYEFVMDDGEKLIDKEYASECVRRFFALNGEHSKVIKNANTPAGFVIVQRINLGLYAIFADLRAKGNWRRLAEEMWPQTLAGPFTSLGDAHHEWYAAHHGSKYS